MTMFVHLTAEKNVAGIRRAGIRPRRGTDQRPGCVFAMPVVPHFYISHQWLRELKTNGQRTVHGVYFRVPDDEPVLVGHYGQRRRDVTADEAAGLIMHAENAEGYEVLIPRKIERSEIHRVRQLPQVLGWRYYPGSHQGWFCGCPVCVSPGSIKGKRKRGRWESKQ